MAIKDFEFNNKKLSDFDSVICKFDDANQIITTSEPAITFNIARHPTRNKFYKTYSEYDECLTTKIFICKDICKRKEYIYSTDEVRAINRWLGVKNYKKLIIKDDFYLGVYFMAVFTNINYIKLHNNIIGFELTLITDLPYAHGVDITETFTLSNNVNYTIIYDSDEYEFYYPSMTITLNESGNLKINNSLNEEYFYLQNCIQGEILTIDNENKLIQSSVQNRKLYDDFNVNFFRLINDEDLGNENIISSNLNCDITLNYSPARKVGII